MTTRRQDGPSSFSQDSKTNTQCLRGFVLIPVQNVICRRIGEFMEGEDTGKMFKVRIM